MSIKKNLEEIRKGIPAEVELACVSKFHPVEAIEEAYAALKEIAANGGKVLFVGTRKQASEAIKEESAKRKR